MNVQLVKLCILVSVLLFLAVASQFSKLHTLWTVIKIYYLKFESLGYSSISSALLKNILSVFWKCGLMKGKIFDYRMFASFYTIVMVKEDI